ncbi:hypothetical protein IscW_ISCW001314 [Ixodes scapularis]|uniref:Uncharacterized protein n=1 Tax=Ixodes scapularis TaxID=6945 RepID=B7P3H5_IXOSC|nr:hypothetical protein IscW_ISCW001314 [Ixodes scapularis]|eukprot:XP_002404175.1 hypothetical protein IscW_ISCW001314 [Ixodes scapularis]
MQSVLQYLGGSLGPGVGSNNPCVVQCQGATGNTWSAAKPWGSPCILNHEQVKRIQVHAFCGDIHKA